MSADEVSESSLLGCVEHVLSLANEGNQHWDGAEVLHTDMSALTDAYDSQEFLSDVTPADIDLPADFRAIGAIVGRDANSAALSRVRIARGSAALRLARLAGYVPEHRLVAQTQLVALGEARGSNTLVAGWSRNRWVPGRSRTREVAHCHQRSAVNAARVANMVLFSRRYQWYVKLGYEGKVGILFPTSPDGAREVFRLRDIPNGKARRSALLHWVSSHWRRVPSLPTKGTMVRQHMRGAESFSWNGLVCKITPAAYDVERSHAVKGASK